MPRIEIYGTEGTLQVPDHNFFRGPVRLRRFREETWSEIPLVLPAPEDPAGRDDSQGLNNLRGIGIADMALAIEEGRAHRASGELARHVLDIMEGIHDASAAGRCYTLKSTCARPDPL
jgi:predicted dehydrogenase